ncbi:MAG TPA: hypothetical protein ENI69_06715 [Rhodospirillales bacterium]|nr:hypothetical protein [Rhodospirillales bacterium]
MPKELRKLVFSKEELKAAAFDYCHRNGVRIPEAPIDELKIEDSDHGFLTLCFETGDMGDTKSVSLGRDQVGAALIKYCSNNKIPIPRQARKVLKVDQGDVALMINLHWQSAGSS